MDGFVPLAADASARELAVRLLVPLEAIANLHYLLDLHVVNPERLKELRKIEDAAFEQMLHPRSPLRQGVAERLVCLPTASPIDSEMDQCRYAFQLQLAFSRRVRVV
jgi:hypothetical protein